MKKTTEKRNNYTRLSSLSLSRGQIHNPVVLSLTSDSHSKFKYPKSHSGIGYNKQIMKMF